MIDLKNLKLITGHDPVLMQPAEKFDFSNPPCDPWELAEALVKTMIDNNGMGLSACQVGLPYAVFAMIGEPNHVMFNPKVVGKSTETIELEEGCLSFPGLVAPITRARHVRVRFTGPDGETTTKQFIGMSARVIQHEMDHLEGVLFFNHLPRVQRDRLFKKATKESKNGKSQETSRNAFFRPLEFAASQIESGRRGKASGSR